MPESTARYRGKKKEKDASTRKRVGSERKSQTSSQGSGLWSFIKFIVKLLIGLPVVLYLLAVLLIYTSPLVRHQVIYLNYAKNPFTNYSDPAAYGAERAVNFYIEGPAGKLGAWYTPAVINKTEKIGTLGDGLPIFLYLHGNAYSRAEKHRVVLYKVLSELSYHVVTFDYRGFADSDGTPSEEGVIEDGLAVWKWIKERSKKSPVYIWGHSLGSGVGTGVAERLSAQGSPPKGLILEAPFNNIYDAGSDHALAQPFKFLPYFDELVMQNFKEAFRTDKRLTHVNCSVLILHDDADDIIPFKYGKMLYDYATATRAADLPRVQLLELGDGEHGHNWIILSRLIPGILREFLEKSTVFVKD